MDVLFIILGLLALAAAVISVVWAFAEETVIVLGIAVILLIFGGWSLHHGWHGESAKFHTKHVDILNAAHAQGFTAVSYGDVFAVGGNLLTGTEVDLHVGKCDIPLVARRDKTGTWRLGQLAWDGGFVTFTPADVAHACPS